MALPDLSGRTAVVTGASRGIGAGLAEAMASQGMRLGLCSRSAPVLADGGQVVAVRMDVTDEGAMDTFAREVETRFGRIDLWINNAGVLDPVAPLRKVSSAAFLRHLQVNVMGVVHGTQAFVRHLRAREGGGVLINISSGAAWQGYAGWAAYCAGKAAVERMTECVALEEAACGLRAHAVAPGVVDTGMQARIRACTPEEFPEVERFRAMENEHSFNSLAFVARHLLALAFDQQERPAGVLVRLPAEGV